LIGKDHRRRHFEVADFLPVETRHLIMMMLRCLSQSCVQSSGKGPRHYQESGGKAKRISLEHVSTPNKLVLHNTPYHL
jgi:hypothetical protein